MSQRSRLPKTVEVPCPRCGGVRTVGVHGRVKYITEALTRQCRRCQRVMARERSVARNSRLDSGAVERLVAGDPPPRTTTAERRQAVQILTSRGLTSTETAARMKVSQRTVERHVSVLTRQEAV